MSNKSRKAKVWEEVDDNIKEKIIELRKNEVEYKERSGYIKWVKFFCTGTAVYSLFFYNFYLKKYNSLNTKTFSFIVIPCTIYGFLLVKMFFNPEAFKEYYNTHIELNRLIKKACQSSEYK